MPTPPQSPRQQVLAALLERAHSTPELVALVGSKPAVRRAIVTLAPALGVWTDGQGRKWYAVLDIPLAKRLSAPRRPGREGHLAGAAVAHLEPGEWRSTGRLARELDEDVKLLYRALRARPDLFRSRPFKGHRLWSLRDDG